MGACGRKGKNKVAPVVNEPATERLEIRKDRWMRVVHYTPRPSAICVQDGVERNEREDYSGSVSLASTTSSKYDRNTVVIFFIHGVGGCSELWDAQLNYFHRAGYEVIAPDLLGHGGSCAPRDSSHYYFQEICNDILVLFDRYSKQKNILVGHSYGSSFCSVVAAERSRMVSKVVLISGGGPIPLRPDNCHLFALPVLLLNCIEPFLACTFRRRAIHQHASRAIAKKTKAFHAPPYVLKAVMEGQLWEEGGESFHNELMVPAMLIYGAEDRFVTLEEEQWMHEAVFGSSLEVIPDAGHMVMLECPDRVNWLIHNFLQRDTSTQSQPQVNARPPRANVSKESIREQIRKQSEARKSTLATPSPLLLPVDQANKNIEVQLKPRSQSLTPASCVQVETLPSPALNVRTRTMSLSSGEKETRKTPDDQSQVTESHVTKSGKCEPQRSQGEGTSQNPPQNISEPVHNPSLNGLPVGHSQNSTLIKTNNLYTEQESKLTEISSIELHEHDSGKGKKHKILLGPSSSKSLLSSNPSSTKGLSAADGKLTVGKPPQQIPQEITRAASPTSPPPGTYKSQCYF